MGEGGGIREPVPLAAVFGGYWLVAINLCHVSLILRLLITGRLVTWTR